MTQSIEHQPPWTWSEEHDEVYRGYIAALNAGLRVARESEVDTGKYTYRHATLEATLNAIEGALSDYKVRVATLPAAGPDGASWGLIVSLIHESGQWMSFPPYIRPLVRDEQGHGSALTYGRRYALTAIFSLIPGEDDDGKAATELVRNEQRLNGARSEAEFCIRYLMNRLPEERKLLIGGEFKATFGKALSALAVGKHDDALNWVVQRITSPDPEPDDPSQHDPRDDDSPGPQS